MKYFLQRDGRTYGPYSYDDLKRYQAENRIGPNDLVRREDSQQWEPWQQALNATPAAPTPPAPSVPPAAPQQPAFGGGGFGQPAAPVPQVQPQQPSFGGGGGFGQQPNNPPAYGGGGFGQPPQDQGFGGGGFGHQAQQAGSEVAGAFGSFGQQAFGTQPPQPAGFGVPNPQFGGGVVGPMPPDMQWWLVLLIGMFTCGIFLIYWIYKQVQFVKKIDPQTEAPKFYKFCIILYVVGYLTIFAGAMAAAALNSEIFMILPMIGQLICLGGAACLIIAAFKMRASINHYYTMVEPMGINLMDTTGALLTFFFSVYFFQYHFANIAMRKKAMGHPAV